MVRMVVDLSVVMESFCNSKTKQTFYKSKVQKQQTQIFPWPWPQLELDKDLAVGQEIANLGHSW